MFYSTLYAYYGYFGNFRSIFLKRSTRLLRFTPFFFLISLVSKILVRRLQEFLKWRDIASQKICFTAVASEQGKIC